ncbi:MAG: NlpC/P60 family protein [Bacteroidales bacterium]|jgi:hypothetical protein
MMENKNQKAIVLMPIVPMRGEASHRSEMITQCLFGDLLNVLEEEGEWCKIKAEFDSYEGFVEKKQIVYLNDLELEDLQNKKWGTINTPFAMIFRSDTKSSIVIPAGSQLPLNGRLQIKDVAFTYSPTIVQVPEKNENEEIFRQDIVEFALDFVGAPYLWGGKTLFGLDCSGFAQSVYRTRGINLLRDASMQATQGEDIGFIELAKSGDLVFFGEPEGNITHVGIYMGEGYIVHASGCVRIDKVDNMGIYVEATKEYTHKLRSIKNIVNL